MAVNGAALTVAAYRDEHLTFDLLEETLDRTNLPPPPPRQSCESRARPSGRRAAGRPLRAGSC